MGLRDITNKVSSIATTLESLKSIVGELHDKLTTIKAEIDDIHSTLKTVDEDTTATRKELYAQRQVLLALAEDADIELTTVLDIEDGETIQDQFPLEHPEADTDESADNSG